ncbi:hypothetical protein [Deinococcus hopiensis]|uniref:Uncharacterized protein n=1 Tax=Deinococcus hopiensis KR-140 TaxID=695939 RepID=A0A1W1VNZ9_9DEIO|nr:hypothetical protein [Deinococcus hopiensis]SMB94801.1 hypothetical protein SAMN00790413_02537 [Deinococcus hopiensis KR-140]
MNVALEQLYTLTGRGNVDSPDAVPAAALALSRRDGAYGRGLLAAVHLLNVLTAATFFLVDRKHLAVACALTSALVRGEALVPANAPLNVAGLRAPALAGMAGPGPRFGLNALSLAVISLAVAALPVLGEAGYGLLFTALTQGGGRIDRAAPAAGTVRAKAAPRLRVVRPAPWQWPCGPFAPVIRTARFGVITAASTLQRRGTSGACSPL